MDIGIIGLGRMGGNMAARLVERGHRVVGHDRSADAMTRAAGDGVETAASTGALIAALTSPRVVWMMVPAGAPVDAAIEDLLPSLSRGDVIVDGGNSWYRDSIRRAEALAAKGIGFIDAGVSGGIWGRAEGYSLMIGGTPDDVARLTPICEALAPAADRGWGHVGPPGAGHFVKMVHNGIEYGMMQAFAEGFAIMKAKEPLALDLAQVAGIWQHGSVVRSWLLDLAARALSRDEALAAVAPWVDDSGEGRWTVQEAIDLNTPAPIITHSLIARLESRDKEGFTYRMLAALRNEFGGHAIKKDA
ncbi:MAG: decarboxylating 6-phosphogluconate dehydrogenase [Acidobacteriota bacterium]|nr:decarboxylating 6-phosphogluconate dehydrogenase [Acidobacteriota bacterium]